MFLGVIESANVLFKLVMRKSEHRGADSGKATEENGGPGTPLFIKTYFVILLNPMENCEMNILKAEKIQTRLNNLMY